MASQVQNDSSNNQDFDNDNYDGNSNNGDYENDNDQEEYEDDQGDDGDNDNENGPKFIRLRGLPWSATHKEILEFLKDVDVVGGAKGINLVTSRWDGKNTGEAYVEVKSEDDLEKAQKLNKATMGHRYIEVFIANARDAHEAMRKTSSHGTSFVVKLRGLPYAVTEQQVEEFFNGLEIKPDREGILFVMDRRGRATGEAFVQFESQEDTEQALGRNREKIGHRYIEIFRSSLAEMKRSVNGNGRPGPYDLRDRGANRGGGSDYGGGRNNLRGGGGGGNSDWGNNGGYGMGANNTLGFNNLPNFTNSGNFGNGFGPNNGGGGGGFGNNGNNGNFGNNGGGGGFGNNGNFGNNGGGGGFGNSGNFGNNGGGGGFGGNNGFNNGGNFGNDLGDFNNFGNNRGGGGLGNSGNFGNNRGGGGLGGGLGSGLGSLGGGGNFGGSGNFGNFGNFGNNGGGSGGGGGPFNSNLGGGGGGGFNSNMGGGGNFGPIGGGRGESDYYVVHMRGLPYTSFENDVFKFFDPVRPANVRINFNKKGLHSGTADAYFESNDEAEAAMKHHRDQMGNRYIELFFDGKTKGGNASNSGSERGGFSRRI